MFLSSRLMTIFNRALTNKGEDKVATSTLAKISKTVKTVHTEQSDRNWRVKLRTRFVKGNKTPSRIPKTPVCFRYKSVKKRSDPTCMYPRFKRDILFMETGRITPTQVEPRRMKTKDGLQRNLWWKTCG